MSVEQWFQLFFVLTLAVAAGVALISKVPPLLHTPLMSGSNAISGITLVGAIAAAGYATTTASSIIAFFAVALATLNVVGSGRLTVSRAPGCLPIVLR